MENQKTMQLIATACKRIAPAWPLKNSVAVNPFLGLSDIGFDQAAKVLKERSGINLSMPLNFYLEELKNGSIKIDDVRLALDKNKEFNTTTESFIKKANYYATSSVPNKAYKIKTLIDISEELTDIEINEFVVDKVSSWASVYFDEFQASWNTSDLEKNIFQSWKEDAQIDLSADFKGIKNFRKTLKRIPDDASEAAVYALRKLNVPEELHEQYLHTLLLKTIGWSSYISGKDWNNGLYKGETNHLESYLSILLAWEVCLHDSFKNNGIQEYWADYQKSLLSNLGNANLDHELDIRLILQNSYDLALQRQLADQFKNKKQITAIKTAPKAQAVFCIDVRSEVYRRNLEMVDPEIETVGFAGFFGFAINYVPLAHQEGKNQCPVLIPAGVTVKETFSNRDTVDTARVKRIGKHQFEKNWKLFKSGAISSFGFVSPIGLSYLPKLISDSFGWTRPTEEPNTDGLKKWLNKGRDLDLSEITLDNKINMAASALTAMGLKENMAPLVLITGHGSSSVNNPHATGLDCGACGGHSGEINAMTAERVLNDVNVREGLREKGVLIPEQTHFIACLHDTTTDEVTMIGESSVPKTHLKVLMEVKDALAQGSKFSRKERANRLNLKVSDADGLIQKRSKDWSQVRPELGLAGCNSFIVAPRKRTVGMNLGGKSFLHSYDWETDVEFKILEAIMTAPMVVTSWINLQYFASTTDNKALGSGNKTLHNVTGGIGVLEGSAGDLRIGLPYQSIHDGTKLQHLPQRLNVVIEAPIKAIENILQKHENIKELCDNNWITLLHLDESGITKRYAGISNWESINAKEISTNKKELVTI